MEQLERKRQIERLQADWQRSGVSMAEWAYLLGARIPAPPPYYANEDERRKAIRKALEWLDQLTPEDAATVVREWQTKPIDPPAPVMPVISEAAVRVAHAAYHKSRGTNAYHFSLGPRDILHWQAELRAAWPIMLRDSVAALPWKPTGNVTVQWVTGNGQSTFSREGVEALAVALGAAPDGA